MEPAVDRRDDQTEDHRRQCQREATLMPPRNQPEHDRAGCVRARKGPAARAAAVGDRVDEIEEHVAGNGAPSVGVT